MPPFPFAHYSRLLATNGQHDRFARLARRESVADAHRLFDTVIHGRKYRGPHL